MKVLRFVVYVGCVAIITISMLGCEHFGNDQDSSITLPDTGMLETTGDLGNAVVEAPVDDDPARIVGGKPASVSKWPSMAALIIRKNDGTYFCGGTLIHKYWVVTAGHCLVGARGVSVILGTSDLKKRPKEKIGAVKAIIHKNYNPRTNNNDIALLKLAKASKQPVTSYNAPASLNGKKSEVAGWGSTIARPPSGNASNFSYVLREVTVPIISNAKCRQVYGNSITNNMLCAGYQQGGKGSCQGDSGGPMVVNNRLVGIVSWGAGCAWRGYYGVYTQVSRYKNWIWRYAR